jgi:hypothetical protein
MNTFKILKVSDMWSTDNLCRKVENLLAQKTAEGYKIVSVAFGTNLWYLPTAFITLEMSDQDDINFV